MQCRRCRRCRPCRRWQRGGPTQPQGLHLPPAPLSPCGSPRHHATVAVPACRPAHSTAAAILTGSLEAMPELMSPRTPGTQSRPVPPRARPRLQIAPPDRTHRPSWSLRMITRQSSSFALQDAVQAMQIRCACIAVGAALSASTSFMNCRGVSKASWNTSRTVASSRGLQAFT
jgi:hypothetical protein